ncbi:C-type lectin domain family 4 member K-like [Electrophorus electricus]|uniref:C-type lectin domain family 4 member K-like n=2 Tax=Electrophorus electricus TaxID=8005 RepID=UPI0015D05264|nr:C-type lectin domain family 4 member K-like [Electrophorus electricus]
MIDTLQNLEKENVHLSVCETSLVTQLSEINRCMEQLQAEKENLTKTLKMKSDHCAQGWKFFSGKCYYFSTDEETWNASRNACVDKGGDLVIVTSPMEQDFLKRSKPGSGSEFYWIGLTDAVVEGEWHWLDGTKLSQTPRYWAGNEPDDWKGDQNAHPEGEDCAVMELSSDSYLLLDAFCNEESKKHKHVCEAKAGM